MPFRKGRVRTSARSTDKTSWEARGSAKHLVPGKIASSTPCVSCLTQLDVGEVRTALMAEFSQGSEQVTESNFLTFDLHSAAILRHLGLNPNQYTLVCLDLDFKDHGDTIGNAPTRLRIGRENTNDFIPLHPR